MRTRRGLCYRSIDHGPEKKRRVSVAGGSRSSDLLELKMRVFGGCGGGDVHPRKRRRTVAPQAEVATAADFDFFDGLPDDIVLFILSKLISAASTPSDFINVLVTCKRFNVLGFHPLVLSRASPRSLAVRARNWSESAHRFLKSCADSGNLEACYLLGMIRFYCLQNRGSGASLMAKAAMGSHASALYSLAVIQFNGSGGTKNDKDLRAGVALCARAAFLGHVDALRELGHCLQDGYGVRQNVAEGRRFLVQANARELARALPCWLDNGAGSAHAHAHGACPLLSDFGCDVPATEGHPANQFLGEWFAEREEGELRMCSHGGCGRPETRRHEFRRCSVCGAVNYCSRACQALDWKVRHKAECAPMNGWVEEEEEMVEEEEEAQVEGDVNGDGV
ncbi:F-box protein [Acorus gramineus]|uniref:F-box protein n=1 Tax=Acorus gramineus TaxID=55184 RepID=A0AAV9A6J2_ACOGR|nr:F-box protein [Acorus gramineus]